MFMFEELSKLAEEPENVFDSDEEIKSLRYGFDIDHDDINVHLTDNMKVYALCCFSKWNDEEQYSILAMTFTSSLRLKRPIVLHLELCMMHNDNFKLNIDRKSDLYASFRR
eukprot:233320_1